MSDESPNYYQTRGLKSLIEAYGDNPVEVSELNFRHALIKAIPSLFAFVLFAVPFTFSFYTSGWLNWTSITFAVLFGLLALKGLNAMMQLLSHINYKVLVYRDRLIIQRNAQIQEIAWDDVQDVYVKTSAGRNHTRYSWMPGYPKHVFMRTDTPLMDFHSEWTAVVLSDGSKVFVTGFLIDYSDISWAIQGEVNSRRYDSAFERFDSGQSVTFGPMTLHPDGIEIDDEKVPWKQHFCSWFDNGKLVNVSQDNEAIGPYYTTDYFPNVALLSKMISDISERYESQRPKQTED
ncbi:MAG TPA: DUF6585 family protein [Gemmataceae bacterium]|jgi:hypothetical protein|nr:DUF6585 family protein [Gemmataceae bacterium]